MLHYQVHREAVKDSPTYLLIHGAGGNLHYWDYRQRRIPGMNVYAIDLPGHGKSHGDSSSSMKSYAEDVVTWMIEMGLDDVILAGHSLGAGIAMTIALKHPEKVSGLVIIGAGMKLVVDPDLHRFITEDFDDLKLLKEFVSRTFSPNADQQMKERAIKRMSDVSGVTLRNDLTASLAFNMTHRASELDMPVLVVAGKDDEITPLAGAKSLSKHMQDGYLKVYPNVGHMAPLEAPELLREDLITFAKSL